MEEIVEYEIRYRKVAIKSIPKDEIEYYRWKLSGYPMKCERTTLEEFANLIKSLKK